MQMTPFHATYMAHELTKTGGTGVDKLAEVLTDSTIDLVPHQVDAALFALRSPFSRGVILGDEVGLGKTIEAGLVIAQKYAEGGRKILIIVPANLRRQWQGELREKFYLDAEILEEKSYRDARKTGSMNPFADTNTILIVSYHFAAAHVEDIAAVEWDMAVIDEAHRLRNVYKTDNIMATKLYEALDNRYKLLLTATPLQNSMLELYGLSSFIDDYVFGNLDSFKEQFLFLQDENNKDFEDLVARMQRLCIRTLRRQVQEYVQYTARFPITQEFTPTREEVKLYDQFTKYLSRDELWAMPSSGRHLMTIQLWKMLASSTFALAGTLYKMIARLEKMLASGKNLTHYNVKLYDEIMASDDTDTETTSVRKPKPLTQKEKASLQKEIDELKVYYELAQSIKHNAKGDALLVAIDKGFKKLKELGAPQKVVIFTESRRTQEYIARILENSRYQNDYVLFNGDLNTDEKRQETEDAFRNQAKIMIATEAAAEGRNLQFCSMLINYDLPYNPQRIEQRIGRIHRYGQKFDVVIVNFLNKENLADQRTYEILCDKFQLFEGVFGASDGVLGSIDALDFEKRLIDIYQNCRTREEIERNFAELRASLEPEINEKMESIRHKLLENFDEDVIKRLKANFEEGQNALNKYETMLWNITKFALEGKYAEFDEERKCFHMFNNPYYNSKHGYKRYGGDYYFNKSAPIAERYRPKCSLAQTVLFDARQSILTRYGEVQFDLTGYAGKLSDLERLKGKSGYLTLYETEIRYAKRRESRLVFAGFCEDGTALEQKQMERMFRLSGEVMSDYRFQLEQAEADKLKACYDAQQNIILDEIAKQNSNYFDEETEKLEKWAKDVKLGLERELKGVDKKLAEVRSMSRTAKTLDQKVELQEQRGTLESKRNELRMKIYEEQDQIDERREELIEEVRKKMTQNVDEKHLFSIKWRIV